MRYFLVDESTYFVDPHGSADFGGSKKFVSNEDRWAEHLSKDEDEDDEDEDWSGSEDGYNAEYQSYYVKEITHEQYIKAKAVIEAYEGLFTNL